MNKLHRTCRGNGDGMYAWETGRNTGNPTVDRGRDQLATRERQAGRVGVAEKSVVPMKLGNSRCARHTWVNNTYSVVAAKPRQVVVRWSQSRPKTGLISGIRGAKRGELCDAFAAFSFRRMVFRVWIQIPLSPSGFVSMGDSRLLEFDTIPSKNS